MLLVLVHACVDACVCECMYVLTHACMDCDWVLFICVYLLILLGTFYQSPILPTLLFGPSERKQTLSFMCVLVLNCPPFVCYCFIPLYCGLTEQLCLIYVDVVSVYLLSHQHKPVAVLFIPLCVLFISFDLLD